jgi:alpha-1,3-rhamnosyl/mannosyltransferase
MSDIDKESTLKDLGIQTPFFLFLGSIQPRKNLLHLLDAHAKLPHDLAKQYPLIIAGKLAWDDGKTLVAIEQAVSEGRAKWLNYISEGQKCCLLQSALALTFVSLYEGFGLPIVESLWHGKKTFASDTPIHREVGGNACVYFPLFDPNALAQAIEAWDSKRTSGGHAAITRERASPTTWEQSASHLLRVVLEAYHRKAHAGAIYQRAA